jgi:hypothetical protein
VGDEVGEAFSNNDVECGYLEKEKPKSILSNLFMHPNRLYFCSLLDRLTGIKTLEGPSHLCFEQIKIADSEIVDPN